MSWQPLPADRLPLMPDILRLLPLVDSTHMLPHNNVSLLFPKSPEEEDFHHHSDVKRRKWDGLLESNFEEASMEVEKELSSQPEARRLLNSEEWITSLLETVQSSASLVDFFSSHPVPPIQRQQMVELAGKAGPKLVYDAVTAEVEQLPEAGVRLLLQLILLTRPVRQLGSLMCLLLTKRAVNRYLIESLYMAGDEGIELLLSPPPSGGGEDDWGEEADWLYGLTSGLSSRPVEATDLDLLEQVMERYPRLMEEPSLHSALLSSIYQAGQSRCKCLKTTKFLIQLLNKVRVETSCFHILEKITEDNQTFLKKKLEQAVEGVKSRKES